MEKGSHFHQETHEFPSIQNKRTIPPPQTKQNKQNPSSFTAAFPAVSLLFLRQLVGSSLDNDNSRCWRHQGQDYHSPCLSKSANCTCNPFQIDVGQIHFDPESEESVQKSRFIHSG